MAKVMLVEDNKGLREALTAALTATGHQVVGAFGEGAGAIAAARALRADVAIVDLGLPGLSGEATIRRLRAEVPSLPVLVLTVFEEPQRIVGAIQAGAQGYLLKGEGIDAICRSLHDVMNGLAPLSAAVAKSLLDTVAGTAPPALPEPLTVREREVLVLLVDGHSYDSSARSLGITLGTVQTHVKSLYRKLEVNSKAEAVLSAVRHRLVDVGR